MLYVATTQLFLCGDTTIMTVICLNRDDYFTCLEGLMCMWDGRLVNDSESRRIIIDLARSKSDKRAFERGKDRREPVAS